MARLKQSKNIYRNINGTKFIQETSDAGEFEQCKRECKAQGLKFRIVKGEFLKEVK